MKKLMQPFKVGEDVGLFLVNFERTCEKLSFAPETWPQRLLTLLPCEAAEVVARLSAGDADDYDKVKSSLLKRYRLSAEAFRQRFRNASKKSSEGYSEFAYGLKTNLIEWLKSEEVYESRDKVVECVCLEQFFRSIPQSVKLWVQDRVGVDSVERAAELAEEYATRRKLSGEESESGRSDQRKTFRQDITDQKPPAKSMEQKESPSERAVTKHQKKVEAMMGDGVASLEAKKEQHYDYKEVLQLAKKERREALRLLIPEDEDQALLTTAADDPVEEVEVAAVRCQPERIEDLCRSTKFTRQELKFMYQGFKQVCPTGLVHENTFRDIYAQFFPQGDVSQYAHYLFQAFDQDHNGTITFQDFVVGLSALSRGAPVDKLRWAFQLYDLNKDGIISRDEMLDIIVSIHSLVGNSGSASGGDDDDPDSVRDHANRVFQ
ncbi:hypothetical protein HPB47_010074, partial [Ixodes persulcatus]